MISIIQLTRMFLLAMLMFFLGLSAAWASNVESDELVDWASRGNFTRIKTLFSETGKQPEQETLQRAYLVAAKNGHSILKKTLALLIKTSGLAE